MNETTKRVICPMCGNNKAKHIKEIDDTEKPLYHFKNTGKPMYAKKYHCNDCRYEWGK